MGIEHLTWQEEYMIGVPHIDTAHEEFFRVVRRVHSMGSHRNPRFAAEEGLKFLKNYTARHFEEEEAYMSSIGYLDLPLHKNRHTHMRDKILPRLEKLLSQNEYSHDALERFLKIMLLWLTEHIMTHDKAIAWGNTTPEIS